MNEELYGYAGKTLRIDLTRNKISKEQLNIDALKMFIGGVGYAAQILYKELSKGINPLGPENKLIFATGPFNGTRAPGSGRVDTCFKSPLTNIWGESSCGGKWGPTLKSAGYDFLIIEGKSDKPVYILIDDENVHIKAGQKLSGKTTTQKIKFIKREFRDEKIEIATIGLSGERLVLFSNIMIGERAAGRCGAGAVMGSKNLLAIAVKGSGKIPIANPQEFSSIVKKYNSIVLNNPGSKAFIDDGTTGDIPSCDALGDFPTKNWRSNSWGKGDELYDYFKNNNLITNRGCFPGCLMPCGRVARVKSGKWKTPEHGGSEYETISAFTAFILNEDVDAAVHASYLCNEYGIDTISMGSVIAFAMDCFENGIITVKDADGLDLRWGNTDAFIALLKKIALKENGIGELLNEGTRRASERIGKGAKDLAMHGKGLEGPAHDPRSGKALAVTYGTANRGMCHIHPIEAMAYDCVKKDFGMLPFGIPDPKEVDRWQEKGKGRIVKILQDGGKLPDILVCCKFYMYVGLGPEHFADMLSCITGWDISGEQLMKIGERAINLQRLFNCREGITRRDDLIPARVCKIPEFGQYADIEECRINDYEGMLDEYYEERGWSKEKGIPAEDKLKELGINSLQTIR